MHIILTEYYTTHILVNSMAVLYGRAVEIW